MKYNTDAPANRRTYLHTYTDSALTYRSMTTGRINRKNKERKTIQVFTLLVLKDFQTVLGQQKLLFILHVFLVLAVWFLPLLF